MAEQMAAQKLESEQAKTEAARAEMGAELEAAYAGLESLRIELETARGGWRHWSRPKRKRRRCGSMWRQHGQRQPPTN